MEAASGPARNQAASSRARWLGVSVAVAAGLLAIQAAFFRVCQVSGASMEPTYRAGDRLLVLRGAGELRRGDVVVVRNPLAAQELLVKRVVGLPGETVSGAGAVIRLDGAALDEPYVKAGTGVGTLVDVRVPPGHVFVLGDNRTESIDSRAFGPVSRDLIVGRVVGTVWGGST